MALVGVPANSDLFGIYPPKLYLKYEDGMVNLRSVVEILYGAKVETKGWVILSPVHKVMQYYLGQWRVSSTKSHAQELLG